jgi:hypothetical protein
MAVCHEVARLRAVREGHGAAYMTGIQKGTQVFVEGDTANTSVR